MRIQFDETNLLSDMVGEENGISHAEADRFSRRALQALKAFQRRAEGKLEQGDTDFYGFPHLPFQTAVVKAVEEYAAGVRGSFDTVCLVGIGGSALGAWALDCGMRGPHPVQGAFTREHPRLVILDNVDPAFTEAALAAMDPRKTLVVAVAKSGGTPETVSTFLIVRDWLQRALGAAHARRIATVTTEGKGDLYALARKKRYPVFAIPENVGGRFSVLSPVGLVPAALLGIDIRKLTRGAAKMTHRCWQPDLGENIALRAALYHWLVWTRRGKPIQVAFAYSNHLWGTAFWFRQLWAESLGKARNRQGEVVHTGQTPVAALGTTDQHSQVQLYIEGPNDKVFTFWAVKDFGARGAIPGKRVGVPAFDALAGQSLAKLIDAERRATAAALARNGHPNCTFTLDRVDEEHLGAFLQMMEFETAFLGELLGINAFNQDGVELGKKLTRALMGDRSPESRKYRRQLAAYEKKRSRLQSRDRK